MLSAIKKWLFSSEYAEIARYKQEAIDDAEKTIEAYQVLNEDLKKTNKALQDQMLDYRILKMYHGNDPAILELMEMDERRRKQENTTTHNYNDVEEIERLKRENNSLRLVIKSYQGQQTGALQSQAVADAAAYVNSYARGVQQQGIGGLGRWLTHP